MESESIALQEKLKKQAKTYEAKIQALQAVNAAMQNENEKLRSASQRKEPSGNLEDLEEEMEEMKEEFQKRLGQSDKAINDLKEERTRLQQLLQHANAGTSNTGQRIAELDASVASLSEEGEALSRKNGEQESSLRKIRQAHKDSEADKEKLGIRVKTLEAQLQEANDRLAREAQAASAQIDDLERDAKDLRVELKKQSQEARREVQEALAKAKEASAKGLDHQLAMSQEREATIASQLQDLRAMMHAMAEEHANKEDSWRRQVICLEERSRQLEADKEAATGCASEASRPLLKQIESMAASSAAAAAAAEQAEERLTARLKAAEADRAGAIKAERATSARLVAAEAAVASATASAAAAVSQAAEMRGRAESERRGASVAEAEKGAAESRLANALIREERAKADLEAVTRDMAEKVWDAEQRIRGLSMERDELLQRLELQSHLRTPVQESSFISSAPPSQVSAVTAESQSGQGLGSLKHADGTTDRQAGDSSAVVDAEVDLLLAELSRASDLNRAQISSSGRNNTGFFALVPSLSSSTSQPAAAPPSEGKGVNPGQVHRTIQVLRERLRVAERERDEAAEQLFAAIKRADEREADARAVVELRQQLAEAGKKVDFALEMLGERNERVEQLEDDISNMKQIFHQQLELCVGQLSEAKAIQL